MSARQFAQVLLAVCVACTHGARGLPLGACSGLDLATLLARRGLLDTRSGLDLAPLLARRGSHDTAKVCLETIRLAGGTGASPARAGTPNRRRRNSTKGLTRTPVAAICDVVATRTQVTDAGVEKVQHALRNCKILH